MTDKILSKTASCGVQVICGKEWSEFSDTQIDGVKFCNDCSKSIILTRLQNEQNASEFINTFDNDVLVALAGKGISIYVQHEEPPPSPLRMKISKAKERALMKEFGLDEAVLSEEDLAKRRSRLKTLIKLGKTRGYLTHGEISDHLPDKLVDAETMEVVITMLKDMGVAVFEQFPPKGVQLIKNTGPTIVSKDGNTNNLGNQLDLIGRKIRDIKAKELRIDRRPKGFPKSIKLDFDDL